MPLQLKPHRLLVEVARQTVVGTLRGVPEYDPPVVVMGMVAPEKSGTVYGPTGVVLQNPHIVMVDLADADLLAVGNRITWGERVFVVETPFQRHEMPGQLSAANHASAHLEVIYAVPAAG